MRPEWGLICISEHMYECIGTQLVLSEVLGGHQLGDSFPHLMCDFTVEGVHA